MSPEHRIHLSSRSQSCNLKHFAPQHASTSLAKAAPLGASHRAKHCASFHFPHFHSTFIPFPTFNKDTVKTAEQITQSQTSTRLVFRGMITIITATASSCSQPSFTPGAPCPPGIKCSLNKGTKIMWENINNRQIEAKQMKDRCRKESESFLLCAHPVSLLSYGISVCCPNDISSSVLSCDVWCIFSFFIWKPFVIKWWIHSLNQPCVTESFWTAVPFFFPEISAAVCLGKVGFVPRFNLFEVLSTHSCKSERSPHF